MGKLLKRIIKIAIWLIVLVLIVAGGLVAWLSITEYQPEDREQITDCTIAQDQPAAQTGQTVTVYSWNIGYAGLGKDSDFFMDGGSMTDPPSQQAVENNMTAITQFIQSQDADAWFLQELDINSSRTERMNQFQRITADWNGSSGFAYNYKCDFVPIPLPPVGKVESGIATLTALDTDSEMIRISLPCAFSWPIRVAQTKRCLLVTRLPVEGSDKELVLVNLHLDAYDNGEGKIAQTNQLMQVLEEEYAKGNYVIAGGDFNQVFPETMNRYPVAEPEKWMPGTLEASNLPEGWHYAYDAATATCRLLDKPYDGTNQLYVIDGFILSPNVQLQTVETIDLDFENADHNPVRLNVTLTP